MRGYYFHVFIFIVVPHVRIFKVPANRQEIGPVNVEITMYCIEKEFVNTKLVQICESIYAFNTVLILKRACLGSQILILKNQSAKHQQEEFRF